jgi:aminoglycoside 3-N-acetyltransferase
MSDSIPTRASILTALQAVGVKPGDTLYVASSVEGLGMMADPLGETLGALFDAVGNEGTLVMPTFNFSFCEGAPFDLGQTPSTCGQLSEAFRLLPGVLRSCSPPYHSIAAWGKYAQALTEKCSTTSFGPCSVFQRLHDLDARHLLLGVGFNAGVAQVHWLEETVGVPYRDWKAVEGEVLAGGFSTRRRFLMYACRDDVSVELDANPLGDELRSTSCLQSTMVGSCEIQSFLLRDFARIATPKLHEDPLLLLTAESRAAFQAANRSTLGRVAV